MLSVSVAMATYNGEQHLGRQLSSLAVQSCLPTELIIVDDGSSDDTLSLLAAFARNAPFPVRIHHNDYRLGYRGNFMRAANLCSAELIAFCDQDDDWYPDKIKKCVAQFVEPDILLVHHNAHVVAENGSRIGWLNQPGLGQAISSGPLSYSLGFTQIFRRSLLPFSNLRAMSSDESAPDQLLAHDQWIFFWRKLLAKSDIWMNLSSLMSSTHEMNMGGQEIMIRKLGAPY